MTDPVYPAYTSFRAWYGTENGVVKVSHEHRPGYYKDIKGEWQPERRVGKERRAGNWWEENDPRRKLIRRLADRDFIERDHRTQIEEALEDFAAEHDGHL